MSDPNEKMLDALLARLRASAPGASYPLDPVERQLLLAEIDRLHEMEDEAYHAGIERDLLD